MALSNDFSCIYTHGILLASPQSFVDENIFLNDYGVLLSAPESDSEYNIQMATCVEFLNDAEQEIAKQYPNWEENYTFHKTYGRLTAIFGYIGYDGVEIVVIWNRPPSSRQLKAFSGEDTDRFRTFREDNVTHYITKTYSWVSEGIYSESYLKATPKCDEKICLEIRNDSYLTVKNNIFKLCYALNDILVSHREIDIARVYASFDEYGTTGEIIEMGDWPIYEQGDPQGLYYGARGNRYEDPYDRQEDSE